MTWTWTLRWWWRWGVAIARLRTAPGCRLGEIPVDAIYSPVRKSAYRVGRTRIGQQTDYDRLNLEVWTDGTVAPEDAVRQSAEILVQHLTLLAGAPVVEMEQPEEEEEGIPESHRRGAD